MRFFAASYGHGRRLTMLAAAGLLAIGLAACSSSGDEAAGTPFTQALAKNYDDLAAQASALPAEPGEAQVGDVVAGGRGGGTHALGSALLP